MTYRADGLPQGVPLYLRVSSTGPYTVSIVSGEPVSALPGPLPVSLDLTTSQTSVAAYWLSGQRLDGQLVIHNTGTTDEQLTLDALTSHFAWSVDLGQTTVSVPAGGSVTVPVTIHALADAWADEPVRISVRARDASGAQQTALVEIEAVRDQAPVNPEQSWSVPAALLGGLDVASTGLGGAPVPTFDPAAEAQLYDGVTPAGAGFVAGVSTLPVTLTTHLAGTAPVPVAGIILNPQAGDGFLTEVPRTFDLLLSTDGVSYQQVLSGTLSPLPIDQPFVLPSPVPATFAQLRITSVYGDGVDHIALGEWKVIATPGVHAHDGATEHRRPGARRTRGLDGSPVGRPGLRRADPVRGSDPRDAARQPGHEAAVGRRLPGRPRGPDHRAPVGRSARLRPEGALHQRRRRGQPGQPRRAVEGHRDVEAGPIRRDGRAVRPGRHGLGALRALHGQRPGEGGDGLGGARRRCGSSSRPPAPTTSPPLPSGARSTAPASTRSSTRPTSRPRPTRRATTTRRRPPTRSPPVQTATGRVQNGQHIHWYAVTVPDGQNTLTFTLGGSPVRRRRADAPRQRRQPGPHDLQGGCATRHRRLHGGRVTGKHLRRRGRPAAVLGDLHLRHEHQHLAYEPFVKEAIGAFGASVVPGREAVKIIPFEDPPLLLDWSDQPYALENAADNAVDKSLSSSAETALLKATEELSSREGARAVLMVTDAETSSYDKSAELWTKLSAARPLVFTVHIGGNGEPIQSRHFMQDWAASAGGFYQYARTHDDVDRAFDRMATWLRRPAGVLADLRHHVREAAGPVEQARAACGWWAPTTAIPARCRSAPTRPSRSSSTRPAACSTSSRGKRRIDIAQSVLTHLVQDKLPVGVPLAFRVFGDTPSSCDTRLAVPLKPLDPAEVTAQIQGLHILASVNTPIGAALKQVASDLAGVTGPRIVVLVTDGEENCGGNPGKAVKDLARQGSTSTSTSSALRSTRSRSRSSWPPGRRPATAATTTRRAPAISTRPWHRRSVPRSASWTRRKGRRHRNRERRAAPAEARHLHGRGADRPAGHLHRGGRVRQHAAAQPAEQRSDDSLAAGDVRQVAHLARDPGRD